METDIGTEGRTTIRVALAQLEAHSRDPERNSRKLSELILAHSDADLFIAPELILTGYQLTEPSELALETDDPLIDRIAQACAETGTAFIGGYIEKSSEHSRPFNSMLVIDAEGSIAANYRKTHLYDKESQAFLAGEALTVVAVAGANIGLMNCFDMEFPEVGRTLAAMGANLFVDISANMDPLYNDHLVACQARALDNRTALVYVNRVGQEASFNFVGGSRVVNAEGHIIAQSEPGEGVMLVEVPLGTDVGDELDYVSLLRPELYRSSPARS